MRFFSNTSTIFIGLIAATSAEQPKDLPNESQPIEIICGSNGTITLSANSTAPGLILLDYGANVEGFPTFEVVSTTGDVSGFKIRYSETKSVLETNVNVR